MFKNLQVIQTHCGTSTYFFGAANESLTPFATLPVGPATTTTTIDAAAITAPAQVTGKGRMDLLTGDKTTTGNKNPVSASIFVNGVTSTEYTALTATEKLFTDGYQMTSQLTLEQNMPDRSGSGSTFASGVCYACTDTACTDKSAYCHVLIDITSANPTTIPADSHVVRVSIAAKYAKAKVADTTTAAATLATAAVIPAYPGYLDASAGLAVTGPVASTARTTKDPTTKGCFECLEMVGKSTTTPKEKNW